MSKVYVDEISGKIHKGYKSRAKKIYDYSNVYGFNQTENVDSDEENFSVPIREVSSIKYLNCRIFTNASNWNPTTIYDWVPSGFAEYKPISAGSRIRFTANIPLAGVNSAHAISNWIFYSGDGTEITRHTIAGYHLEQFVKLTHEVDSWGTYTGLIGYKMRAYANDSNEVRVLRTRYFNGGGNSSIGYCRGQVIIEEFEIPTWEDGFEVGSWSAP